MLKGERNVEVRTPEQMKALMHNTAVRAAEVVVLNAAIRWNKALPGSEEKLARAVDKLLERRGV